MPNFAIWRQALNHNISLQLHQEQSRSFSHLYRRRRLSFNKTHHDSITKSPQPVSFDVQNLLTASHARTYSASHRKHQVALINKIAVLFKDQGHGARKDQYAQYRTKSVTEVLATQSFSHQYRERQLVYLRACLPLKSLHSRGHRCVSSVPLLTHMTESDTASRSKRRISWILKILGAGITVVLALRFVKEQDVQQSSILNDVTYVPFTIKEHVKISPTTSILTLQSHSDELLSPMLPISSISIKEPNSNIQRPYTVLSCEGNTIKILVKKYEAGELSRYIHSRKLNADLYLRMAPSAYELPTDLPERYLLIMAGTGIATAFQLLNHLTKSQETPLPQIKLLYASGSPEEVYLRKELAELQAKFGERLSVEYYIDTEGTFITADRLPSPIGPDTTTLVCGSDGFVSYVAGAKPEEGQGELGGLLKQVGAAGTVWKL